MLHQGFFDACSVHVAGDLHVERVHGPDVVAVLADGSIGGEEPGAGCVEQRHPVPVHPVAPSAVHRILSPQVVGVVGHHKEGVVAGEVVQQRPEQFAVAVAEVPHLDQP